MTRNSLKCDLARVDALHNDWSSSSSGRIDRGECQANRICLIILGPKFGSADDDNAGTCKLTMVIPRSKIGQCNFIVN